MPFVRVFQEAKIARENAIRTQDQIGITDARKAEIWDLALPFFAKLVAKRIYGSWDIDSH